MSVNHSNFDAYAFSKQPGYDEAATRKEFAKAIPLRTVVIYCYDPRAADIPAAIAHEFDEVYPGENLLDEDGNRVGASTTMLEVVVAGGRAVDALRSVTVAQHLLGVENVVVVHHTHCGATTYTFDGIVDAFQREQGVDIADLYDHDSVCISDFQSSLEYDTRLLRQSKGTPKHVNIYGYMYDIDTGALTRVVEDRAEG